MYAVRDARDDNEARHSKLVQMTGRISEVSLTRIVLQGKWLCHTFRRQIDITTYQLLFFLSDTSLCLFGDDFKMLEAKGKIPRFSSENKMGFPPEPYELPLIELEERLVSPVNVFIRLRELPRGEKASICENAVNVLAENIQTVKMLEQMKVQPFLLI